MKLQIVVDGLPYFCDTTDPDLLGRWIVEIFGRIGPVHPATLIEFKTWPSVLPQNTSAGALWHDWIADSRIIGDYHVARSPRELVSELGKLVDELDAG